MPHKKFYSLAKDQEAFAGLMKGLVELRINLDDKRN
jgi:hypothetical protein